MPWFLGRRYASGVTDRSAVFQHISLSCNLSLFCRIAILQLNGKYTDDLECCSRNALIRSANAAEMAMAEQRKKRDATDHKARGRSLAELRRPMHSKPTPRRTGERNYARLANADVNHKAHHFPSQASGFRQTTAAYFVHQRECQQEIRPLTSNR